jgi:hypothetical protein
MGPGDSELVPGLGSEVVSEGVLGGVGFSAGMLDGSGPATAGSVRAERLSFDEQPRSAMHTAMWDFDMLMSLSSAPLCATTLVSECLGTDRHAG